MTTLRSFDAPSIMDRDGEGIDAYIVSMTRGVDDILRPCCWRVKSAWSISRMLPVWTLFPTIEDLDRSGPRFAHLQEYLISPPTDPSR